MGLIITQKSINDAISKALKPIVSSIQESNKKLEAFEKRIKALEGKKEGISVDEINGLKKLFMDSIKLERTYNDAKITEAVKEAVLSNIQGKFDDTSISFDIEQGSFVAKIEGQTVLVGKIEEKKQIIEPKFCEKAEKQYLLDNPLVAEAVRNGGFANGWEHFQKHGKTEGREWHTELCK